MRGRGVRAVRAWMLLVVVAACGRFGFDAHDATPGDADDGGELGRDGDAATTCGARMTAGRSHLCVHRPGAELACWGDNTAGQLGIAATALGRSTAEPVPGLGPVTAASAGRFSTCAARADGRISCLGENSSGQLGNNTTTPSESPVDAIGLTGAVELASAAFHACAIAGDAVWCWGEGGGGRLGTGDQASHLVPVAQGSAIIGPRAITAGGSHTCVIDSTSAAWCWGVNTDGQLGIDSIALTLIPVQPMIGPVLDVRVRDLSSCVVTLDRQAWCFGNGEDGQLGDGGTVDRHVPVAVAGVTDAAEVGVGIAHACARTTSGDVSCWGLDANGALGDGAPGGIRATAAPVIGLPPVSQLAVAAYASCAMTADGDIWCWGLNDQGQLGVPLSTTSSATPVFAFDACP